METTYRDILNAELERRLQRNGRYSIRAFAKALALDAGSLSRVLAGKQIPGPKMGNKICRNLGLGPAEQQAFLQSLAIRQAQRSLQRISPVLREFRGSAPAPKDLQVDLYKVIADWYHVALLELTYVEGFRPDTHWIAKQLGITILEAKLALDRLELLGLVERKGKTLVKVDHQLSTTDKELSTQALRKNQRQWLEKAIDSLDNDPIEERSVTSMTMAIDPDKLPLARKAISEFNRHLCRLLEDGRRRRVYNLEVALYPVQKASTPGEMK